MQSSSFSNSKGDVCECRANSIKLSECKRDISRHVQKARANLRTRYKTVMKSATKGIFSFAVQVNPELHISRANFSTDSNHN